MARPVVFMKKVYYGALIRSYLVSGSYVDSEVYEGEILNDFSFVENGEVKTITGKLKKVNVNFYHISNALTSMKTSLLAQDARVFSLEIDASSEYESAVHVVPSREILEYETTEEVKKVVVLPIVKVNLKITLSDGTESEMELEEGKELFDVVINERGEETTKDYVVGSFLYRYKNIDSFDVDVIGLILVDDEGDVVNVPFQAIKSLGECGIEVTDPEEILDAITEAMESEDIAVVELPVANVADPLSLTGDITINGAQEDVPANTGDRAVDKIGEDETVFSGSLACEEGTEIEINGVALTADALLTLNKPSAVSLTNCKILDVTPNAAKSYLVKDGSFGDTATKLVIEHCYFGSNPAVDGNKMYNLFELNCKLADGSRIANNFFTKENCTHNVINIYDVEDGATITIEGNEFEYSGNAIRLGMIGEPNCTFNINANTYHETDMSEDGAYAGLLLIQPYGTRTTSMANVTINLDNTHRNDELQLYYVYCGGSDTQLDDTTKPKVYVDGVLQ